MAKRRICSNDMAEVPADAFLLDDGEGQMFFCNPRCLCLWAVALGTRSELPEKQKAAVYTLANQVCSVADSHVGSPCRKR